MILLSYQMGSDTYSATIFIFRQIIEKKRIEFSIRNSVVCGITRTTSPYRNRRSPILVTLQGQQTNFKSCLQQKLGLTALRAASLLIKSPLLLGFPKHSKLTVAFHWLVTK